MKRHELQANWEGMGFTFGAHTKAEGVIGHAAGSRYAVELMGAEDVTRADLAVAGDQHGLHLLAIFLGQFFPDWADGAEWLKRRLNLLSQGSVMAPIKRDGWWLRLSFTRATGILTARVSREPLT